MTITSLSSCLTHFVCMFPENVIKHFYFHIYFKKIFLKVDLSKTCYVIKQPKNTSKIFKTFYGTKPDNAK